MRNSIALSKEWFFVPHTMIYYDKEVIVEKLRVSLKSKNNQEMEKIGQK